MFVDFAVFSVTSENPCPKYPKCQENSLSCALTSGSTGSSRGATRLRLLRGVDLVGASRSFTCFTRSEGIPCIESRTKRRDPKRDHFSVISVVAGGFFNQNGTVELLGLEHIGTHFEMNVSASTALRRSRQVLRPSVTRQAATQAGLAPRPAVAPLIPSNGL